MILFQVQWSRQYDEYEHDEDGEFRAVIYSYFNINVNNNKRVRRWGRWGGRYDGLPYNGFSLWCVHICWGRDHDIEYEEY
jgi:hypothetical protein